MKFPDNVHIRIIPHATQRYPTVGDWLFVDNSCLISISDMGNDEYHFLVAVHEYIEAFLCREAGISEEEVTAFDKEFERMREAGQVTNDAEPGDDGRAPYYMQHKEATRIEQKLALVLGVDWNEYDMAIRSL